ncbi:MAG: hypothetical protein WDW36_003457 [Sanguina aurantia]
MEVDASPSIDAPVHAEGEADRPLAGAVPGASLPEWHNYLGERQQREGDPCQAPSSPTLSSASCDAQPVSEEACSRPQDEQRERRPMSRPGHSSIRSSMSDGTSTMRLSGCFQHRVRFCDEGERPAEVEGGMGSFSAAFNPATTGSLFIGSGSGNSSRGMAVPRLDTSKVIPTILLNGAGRSTMMPRLDTSKVVSSVMLEASSARQNRPPVSSRSPRNATPPPSSSRALPPQRTTPRSGSASSFGSTNSTSTAASPRPGAVQTTPRSAKDSAAPAPKAARPSPARAPPPSFQATRGSVSARKATVITAPSSAAVAADTSTATAAPASASASVGIRSPIATGPTGSGRLTPRGSTTPSHKAQAKRASSAKPLPVPAAAVQQAASPAHPSSKPIPVPVGRQVSGRRSSAVAGGGALVSAPSRLPWSSTIGVRPLSQAFPGNISQLQEGPRLPEPDRRARPSATGSDFRFTPSEQPSSSPSTPAKVGSFAHRHPATAVSSPAEPASGVSRARNWAGLGTGEGQPRHDSTCPASEAGQGPEPDITPPAERPSAPDPTGSSPESIDTDSVTLEVQQHQASDVWALDNRSEEEATREPRRLSTSHPAAAAARHSRPRTATARSTAVVDGTAAAWSPEGKPAGTSSAARFIPASLQLHDVELAKRVEAAAVCKAMVLELVKMVVADAEGAKLKRAEQLAAAGAAPKGASRRKEGGKTAPAGDATDRRDSPVPIKMSLWGRLFPCLSPV